MNELKIENFLAKEMLYIYREKQLYASLINLEIEGFEEKLKKNGCNISTEEMLNLNKIHLLKLKSYQDNYTNGLKEFFGEKLDQKLQEYLKIKLSFELLKKCEKIEEFLNEKKKGKSSRRRR